MPFHSLRRAATTLLHESGTPAAVAQALIGRDSEEMHRLYVGVGREAMEKAVAAMGAGGKQEWQVRRDRKSPSYTTRLADVPRARI